MPVYFPGNGLPAGVKPVGITTRSQAGVAAKAGDITIPLVVPASLLIIGDSTQQYGTQPGGIPTYAVAYVSDSKGIAMNPLGVGVGVNTTSAGTLEYRASDRSVRWAAPGDAPGDWTSLKIGTQKIESGTPGRYFAFSLRSLKTLPSTDQSVSVTNSGTLYAIRKMNSAIANALSRLRNGFTKIAFCGAGGAHLAEMSEMIPWYLEQAPGPGYVVWRGGTNSIARGDALGVMQAEAKYQLDCLLAEGKKIVVCGTHARWATVGVSLSASQIALGFGFNRWLRDYCASHQFVTEYVDMYALSVDVAYNDFRPAAGVLADPVHDAEAGLAQSGGAAIAIGLKKLGAPSGFFATHGDPENKLQEGFIKGSNPSGLGVGITGTVPYGWEASRSAGTDLVAESSIEPRTDKVGNWWRLDWTATAGSQRLSMNTPYSGRKTLAQIGKTVGDLIRIECDLELSSLSGGGVVSIECFAVFTGAANIRTQCQPAAANGSYGLVSPEIPIPAGVTHVQFYFYLYPGDSSSGTVRVADMWIP